MPYKVWSVGEEVLAADFNSLLQEQTIATFASTAARDAAITAPKVGQAAYVVGVGLTIWHGAAGGGWLPPWDTAWGMFYGPWVTMTANLSGLTIGSGSVQIPGLVFPTFTPPNNRRLRIWARVPVQGGGAANGGLQLKVLDGATTLGSEFIDLPTTLTQRHGRVEYLLATAGGAARQFKIEGALVTGGGTTWSTNAAGSIVGQMGVEDLGPHGAWS